MTDQQTAELAWWHSRTRELTWDHGTLIEANEWYAELDGGRFYLAKHRPPPLPTPNPADLQWMLLAFAAPHASQLRVQQRCPTLEACKQAAHDLETAGHWWTT